MTDTPGHRYLKVGYFACRRIIRDLQRFADLVRHDQRWAHQMDFARPWSELGLGVAETDHRRHWILDREIARMAPVIQRYMHNIGMSTEVTTATREHDLDDQGQYRLMNKEDRFDILNQYSQRMSGTGQLFDILLEHIEAATGLYQRLQTAALRRYLDPRWWVACVLRLPIDVLEMAGLNTSKNVVVEAYAWVIRAVVFALLAMAAARLGLSVPWAELMPWK